MVILREEEARVPILLIVPALVVAEDAVLSVKLLQNKMGDYRENSPSFTSCPLAALVSLISVVMVCPTNRTRKVSSYQLLSDGYVYFLVLAN